MSGLSPPPPPPPPPEDELDEFYDEDVPPPPPPPPEDDPASFDPQNNSIHRFLESYDAYDPVTGMRRASVGGSGHNTLLRLNMHDAETQNTDPSSERNMMGFMKPNDLRERVVDTMLTGVYNKPTEEYRVRKEAIATQTDNATTKESSAGDGDTDLPPPLRDLDLDLELPKPQDFPVLTVSQLLDAEKRLHDLIARLETELLRVHDHEKKEKDAALGSLSSNLQSSRAGIGGRNVTSTSQWFNNMSQTVEKRMRVRHQDPVGETLPSYWTKQKVESAHSPVRGSRNSDHLMRQPNYSTHLLQNTEFAHTSGLLRRNFASAETVDGEVDFNAAVAKRAEKLKAQKSSSRGMQIATEEPFWLKGAQQKTGASPAPQKGKQRTPSAGSRGSSVGARRRK